MNKSEFLKRLAALLHILQEDEVRDILDEYEQHIDMKVAGGMSEQEVIRDFGSVEELVSEILSAYHVRPDFKPKKENNVLGKVSDGSKKAFDNAGHAVKNVGSKTGSFLKKLWNNLLEICRSPVVFVRNLWAGLKQKRVTAKEERQLQKTGDDNMTITGVVKGVGHGCVNLCKSIFLLCIRFCFACIFVCAGFMEVGLVAVAGMLLILMALGYPVVGITIAVVGAAMATFVVIYYSAKKMRRRA